MGTPGIPRRSQLTGERRGGHEESAEEHDIALRAAGSSAPIERGVSGVGAAASHTPRCRWGACCTPAPSGAGVGVQVCTTGGGQSDAARCMPCSAARPPPPSEKLPPAAETEPAKSAAVRVLILFSGRRRPGSIATYLTMLGAEVVTFEIMDDSAAQDLSAESVQSAVLGRVRGGEFDAVFLAPPCASFCFALRPILRSLRYPMGRQDVPRRWQSYLRKHNSFVRFSAQVCLAAETVGAAWMVENPASRRRGMAFWSEMAHRPTLWDTQPVLDLVTSTDAVPVTAAQCQFGSEYQKYTTFLCSSGAAPYALQAIGLARCNCTEHAKVAKGYDEFGESLSAPAAAYPPALCEQLAGILLASARSARTSLTEGLKAQGLEMGSADPHMLCLHERELQRSHSRRTSGLRKRSCCSAQSSPLTTASARLTAHLGPDATK